MQADEAHVDERILGKDEVAGSNPVVSSNFKVGDKVLYKRCKREAIIFCFPTTKSAIIVYESGHRKWVTLEDIKLA